MPVTGLINENNGHKMANNRDLQTRKFKLFLDKQWLTDKADRVDYIFDLCKHDEEIDIIFHLLEHFTHLEEQTYRDCLNRIIDQVKNVWELVPAETQIAAFTVDTQPDGAQLALQKLRPRLAEHDWELVKTMNTINGIPKMAETRPNIILFDEFSGTGRTVISRVKTVRERIHQREKLLDKEIPHKIYVCLIAAMGAAKTLAAPEMDSQQDGVPNYFAAIELERGISDFFDGENCSEKIRHMRSVESTLDQTKLGKYPEFPSLGYGQAEALFAISDDNIPNSVFPIFWWKHLINPKETHSPLFYRLD